MSAPARSLILAAAVFPALQVAAFTACGALAPSHPLVSAGLFLAAALLLCLSVHVSVHEVVHQSRSAEAPLAGPILSVVMGLPFQGYRWHHLNHHRWNNALDDYSTTWWQTPAGPRPWPLWRYVLGWPRQLARSGLAMRAAAATGGVPRSVQRAIRREQLTLLVFIVLLGALAPRLAATYVALVYVGWALIALQNYGQHPPRQAGTDTPTSYHAALYNRLLFGNGLHAEHHERPHVPWHALRGTEPPARIGRPHLLQPFFEKDAAVTEAQLYQILGTGNPFAYTGLVALGAACGGALIRQEARGWRLSPVHRYGIIAAAFIGGLAGSALPAFWSGGLIQQQAERYLIGPKTILGGVIASFLAVALYKRALGLRAETSDAFARGACLMMAIGRLGCAMAHCCVGVRSDAWWAHDFGDGVPRLPIQLVEAAGLWLLFGVMHLLHVRGLLHDRRLFVLFAAYGVLRAVLESWRETVAVPTGGLGFYQWLALLLAAIGLFQLARRTRIQAMALESA